MILRPIVVLACAAGFCTAVPAGAEELRIGYEAALEMSGADAPAEDYGYAVSREQASQEPPSSPAPPHIGYSRKLLLTNGVTSIEGSSGGGIATWAVLAGAQEQGLGLSAHATTVILPDFNWRSFGAAVSYANRIELSYARQNFDTQDVGAALGIGQGYVLNQDVFGAKVRLFGDVVYGDPLLPQVSIGIQHKRSLDGPIALAVGAAETSGTDYYVSATKLFLSHSLLASATLRYTKANQGGLLGYGSAAGDSYALQFEGSLGYQLSRRALIGAEFRTKPDNLGLGEDDWFDIFAAYSPADFITLTAAYADLGSIATFEDQRGAFLQAQLAF